ncbi:MAG: hypothetical protein PW788_02220 [Micavibrio sp.]|nr:hypothetical protein [Micavibrio sp.]
MPPAFRDDFDDAAQQSNALPAIEGSTAALLQDLAFRIIPRQRFDEVRDLVRTGRLDVTKVWEENPLMSPLSQLAGAPEWKKFLQAAFADAPEAALNAPCPCHSFRSGGASTDPSTFHATYSNTIETPNLATFLLRSGKTMGDVAEALPQLLAAPVGDYYNNNPQPMLFMLLANEREIVAMLDALEKSTGGCEFLYQKNARGETLFNTIAQNASYREDPARLDAASWMLQRRPALVNECDRFGWTPLDRFISSAGINFDCSMGRLLVAAGAEFARQVAPGFNLATAVEERAGRRLDKPQPKKPGLAP